MRRTKTCVACARAPLLNAQLLTLLPLQYEGARLSNSVFRITGRIEHGTVAIQRPVAGMIKARPRRNTMRFLLQLSCSALHRACAQVEHCALPLKSIELTLGRVEWCTVGDHSNSVAREATDIQCTQVADGDVARGVELPIHLVLPRLYTCPTVDADSWGVEFELGVCAVFEVHGGSAYATASARMPLRLVRGKRIANEPA